ncbi:hypothetical protein [Mucilaginibacter dorajii]|uniref:Addiction module toxin RelE n=1 Tax=Mucilaginibacter dorajii TaxID=692994 RepID=A0ABP7PD78_9SPHI|nr:hypothetical protein [Mucilaginibacter dorajii]MCS3735142.1 mRNA-degrading endonuclease RelE of RelBE toxin-antitoxin system [Mucilaginibacter dorajii]
MSYKVIIASSFGREAKRIAKKQPGIKSDISKLIADLEVNPIIGTSLGHSFYKVRLAITGTGKGKSGGARVITYVVLDNETVILAEIYLKSEHDTSNIDILILDLQNQGLI